MKTILLICTANRCRSPMAAALLQDRLRREGLDGRYQVQSAGTWAIEDVPATAAARQVMAERGLDIEQHRSHNVSCADLERTALVLVMTQNHREALAAECPSARGKIFLLSEMAGVKYDIPDPYLGSLDSYRACVQDLVDLIDQGLGRILELAG